ncbi:MAG TPA: LTA synthase family protein, partial [Nitrospirae bacterium]|nr:LTA synthase family protein [Nitrospirota bacterium]
LLQRFAISGVRTFVLLAASLAAASVTVVIPIDINSPDWLQMSALEANFQSQRGGSAHVLKQDFPEHIRKRFLHSDISDNTFLNYPDKPQNILLIIMEGVSYNAMDSDNMPYLNKLGQQNITYTNFISLQRQTNRTLFTILCGDYPNFLTQESKSDYYGAFGAPRACLPEILAENSYTNTFLQGSNLGYMGKDHFAAAIGFHEIYGNASFNNALGRTEWGVDDLTLFRRARTIAKDLSGQGSPPESPWMLTVLTSGSHHPYNVPGVLLPEESDVLFYLDNALEELVEGLRVDGLLENTLVLITSDESTLLAGNSTGQNHIPMVAIIPGYDKPFHHPGFLSQIDIQLSILDYLGIPVRDSIGRSIFRYYSSGREIIFGNIYQRRVYLINTNTNSYVTCSTFNFLCMNRDMSAIDPSLARDLRTFLQYNDLNSQNLADGTLFHLVNATYTGSREIMGDRKVILDRGDTITIDLAILPDGPIEVGLVLDGTEMIHKKIYYGLKGKLLRVHFTHTSDRNDFAVFNNLEVRADPHINYTIKELLITKKKAQGN